MEEKNNLEKKVTSNAAKVAGNALGGPAGGMLANKLAQTKVGKNLISHSNPLAKLNQNRNRLSYQTTSNSGNPSEDNFDGSSSNGEETLNSGLSSSFEREDETPTKGKVKGTIKPKTKIKIITIILIPFISLFFSIAIIGIIATNVMAPIMTVRDSITKLAQNFTTGIEKFINFTQGEGWMTNEDSFFNYLDEQYNKFTYTTSSGAQLDIPLVAATIHYSKMVDLSQYEESVGVPDEGYDSEDFEQLGTFLSKDQTVSFYDVAKDKLGSVNTIWPGQKRLLGHIVKTEITVVDLPIGEALGYWNEFLQYMGQSLLETSDDVLKAIADFVIIYDGSISYQEITGDALAGEKYDYANVVYEYQEFFHNFSELYSRITGQAQTTIDENGNTVPLVDENGNLVSNNSEGWLKVPTPIIKRTMHYGYDEYKQMKNEMLKMRAILRSEGLNFNTDEDALSLAQNSSNSELKDIYENYKKLESQYMYSYTHYLQNVYVPFTYFYKQEYTQDQIDNIIDEIYDQRDFYNYLVNEPELASNCGGSCTYPINGEEVSNLKVRLLQCSNGDLGKPIPGEELVDFEKYVLGVVYAEIGPDAPAEAIKTQAIAARSYALTRPKEMGNAAGLKLAKEGENWVLSIRNCTQDQVYCDPDRGCSNTTDPSKKGNSTTVYSGVDTKPYKYKGPLPEDSQARTIVMDVAGKVLLDKNSNIVPTTYTNKNQTRWKSQAREGMDYTEILMADYEKGHTISTSLCSNVCNKATGDYTQWKQSAYLGAPWANVVIGRGKTINDIGCLVTSVAIQIARSGVPLQNINGEFNPGTFVEALKSTGGFASEVLFIWNSTSKIAPSFQYQNSLYTNLTGLSKNSKAQKIQDLINQGCYVVMEVKGNGDGEHWVAVDYVDGSEVYVMNPSRTETKVWDSYPHNWTSQARCYKVIN